MNNTSGPIGTGGVDKFPLQTFRRNTIGNNVNDNGVGHNVSANGDRTVGVLGVAAQHIKCPHCGK